MDSQYKKGVLGVGWGDMGRRIFAKILRLLLISARLVDGGGGDCGGGGGEIKK